jgi:hypothetical protein
VDREEEGLSSNRPELVVLWECLETRGTSTTKQTVWTQAVRNRIRQKAGRSKLTGHTRREWISDARSTCREKEKEISLRKVRKYWKTETFGEMRQPFTEQSTNPENEKESTKTVYSCYTCYTRKDQSHPRSL